MPETGIISLAKQISSPNFDLRPDQLFPEVLIIHAISLPPGTFGGNYIAQLFCNQLDPDGDESFQEISSMEVSAHVLIQRTGEMIQFVSLNNRAWHAGESECEGRNRVNDFSIGIELEGCDQLPFTDNQYNQLADLTNAIFSEYPAINANRIYGHADISPGRKTDPGPHFDWPRYKALLGV
ncbi:MAG: 1,6-anhydro-N-acetylmuramyl-L-alanine amidase AmpD [Acidiferrobacterales bacterium]